MIKNTYRLKKIIMNCYLIIIRIRDQLYRETLGHHIANLISIRCRSSIRNRGWSYKMAIIIMDIGKIGRLMDKEFSLKTTVMN